MLCQMHGPIPVIFKVLRSFDKRDGIDVTWRAAPRFSVFYEATVNPLDATHYTHVPYSFTQV